METTNKTGRQVLITQAFSAPRELVYKAWTDKNLLEKWYAPTGCTITFSHLDVRMGGTFHSCVHIAEADYDCWCIGTYLEIVPNEKLVFTMINADEQGNRIDPATIGMDADWPGETTVTVTFTETDGKTVVTLHQTVSETLAKKTGAHPSWLLMLEKLNHLMTQ